MNCPSLTQRQGNRWWADYLLATPQISTVMSFVCICGWGTTVMGGSGPGMHAATVLRNDRVSSSVPLDVKFPTISLRSEVILPKAC